MIGDPDDKASFPHKLLLTDAQVSRICKAFANGSTVNIQFSKTQLPKTIHSGEFVVPNAIDTISSFLIFLPFRTIHSLVNLYRKELENKNPKDLILLIKKFKKEFHQLQVQE